MSSTRDFALSDHHKPLLKVEHYFDIYDTYLRHFQGTSCKMLEIGVYNGGSLEMWKDFLGPNSTIHGIDISTTILGLQFSPGISASICNQEDKPALKRLSDSNGGFDIVLDDGGHHMSNQIKSFEALFPLLKPNGVYMVEDTHTSYWKSFGGGLRKPGSFMEYAKAVSDYVNVDHFREADTLDIPADLKDSLKRELTSITFYDSMIVFTKGQKATKRAFWYNGKDGVRESGPLTNYS
jgi:hypothetical protein